MKRFNEYFAFLYLLIFQLLLENLFHYLLDYETIKISWSLVFLFNIFLFFFLRKKYIFYLIQFISVLIYTIVLIPHYYFFNIFSFIKRINYFFITPEKFIIPILIFIVSISILYGVFRIQFKLLNQIKGKFYFLPFFVFLLVLLKFITNPIQIKKNSILFSYVGSNYITSIISDFKKYNKGKKQITSYSCDEEIDGINNNVSPTISFLYDNNRNKDFLVIMESWGELKISDDQIKLMERLKSRFLDYNNLSSSFNLKLGRTCFHGNTSSAEGRELLNMNDEESYQSFLNNNSVPSFNIVKNKLEYGFHTISGFSASKQYGSNYSNAEGFRNALNFDSKIYFEDLKDSYEINYENNYNAVFDESLIDTIISESKLYEKVFAYALTINTHTPFSLDKEKIKIEENYMKMKNELLDMFNQNESAFDQFYRIYTIINHVFERLEEDHNLFDRVLIVGDHANPDFNSRGLYNKTLVPYIYLERK